MAWSYFDSSYNKIWLQFELNDTCKYKLCMIRSSEKKFFSSRTDLPYYRQVLNHLRIVLQLRDVEAEAVEAVKCLWKQKHFEERIWKQKRTWKHLTFWGVWNMGQGCGSRSTWKKEARSGSKLGSDKLHAECKKYSTASTSLGTTILICACGQGFMQYTILQKRYDKCNAIIFWDFLLLKIIFNTHVTAFHRIASFAIIDSWPSPQISRLRFCVFLCNQY